MKRIKQAIPLISNLLGMQKTEEDTKYHESSFSFSVSCPEGVLLFHTLTQAIYLLEGDEKPADFFDVLLKERFFIPERYDEEKIARDVIDLGRRLAKKNNAITAYTILTTTDCNARCYYCYESGRKRLSMTDKTAHDVAEYIIHKCKGKEVSLLWFGGEPLFNQMPIEIITDCLRKNRIPFHSRMISNGYYLDKTTIRKAKEKWNLKRVQITLDGTKDVYLRAKAYIEQDENAFDRVMNNIEHALISGINVVVRLNIDGGNVKDMHDLIPLLGARFGAYTGFHAYAALLKPIAGDVQEFPDEIQEYKQYVSITDLLDQYGIGRVIPLTEGLHVNRCMADSDASEVLLPDGRIGKCEHFTETELVGSIYDDKYDEVMLKAWKEIMPKYPECHGCPLYPRCIYLVKCDYTETNCSKAARMRGEYNLKRQVLSEYNRYKQKETNQ